MRPCLLIAVAFTSMGALAQPVAVGPERQLALPPLLFDAEGVQERPALAGSGNGYLVVWQSTRATELPQVYSTLLNQSGARVTITSDPLLPAAVAQTRPAIAYGAGVYVVAWAAGASGSEDLQLIRVSATTGLPIDTVPRALVTGTGAQVEPSIAFDGSQFLIAYTDQSGASKDVRAVRFDPASLMVTANWSVAVSASQEETPSVAFDGTHWLIAYATSNNAGDVLLARLTSFGTSLAAPLPIEATTDVAVEPQVAADSGRWAVAWLRPGAVGAVLVTRGSGSVAGTTFALGATETQSSPRVTALAGSLWVAFHESQSGVVMRDVPSSGSLGAPVLNYSGFNADTEVGVGVSGAQAYTVVVVPPGQIRGNPLGGSSSVKVAQSSSAIRDLQLANVGGGVLAVWSEHTNLYTTYASICSQRLTLNGTPAADAGELEPWRIGVGTPSVVSNGRTVLAAWRTSGAVQVVPLSALGSRLDGGVTITVGGNVTTSRLGLAVQPDAGALLAWADDHAGSFLNGDLYFSRVSESGAVLDGQGVPLAVGSERVDEVAVAFNGSDFALAWSDNILGALKVARVDPSGTILAPGARQVATQVRDTSFTSGASEALLLWSRTTDAGLDVFAARSLADGGWPDDAGVRLFNLPGDQRRPVAQSVGNRYLLAFDSLGSPQKIVVGELDFAQSPPFAATASGEWVSSNALFCRDLVVTGPGQALLSGTRFALQTGVTQSRRGFVYPVTFGVGVDAGSMDAGSPDAGADAGFDAGLPDAGLPDAGSDAGLADAGSDVDAGLPDSGPNDAGVADAGTPDAGAADAGSEDAGAGDGGTVDGGTVDGGQEPRVYALSCGCQSSPGRWWFALLVPLMMRRRRGG